MTATSGRTALRWMTSSLKPSSRLHRTPRSWPLQVRGVKLLDLDADDKVVVAAMVIPPEDPKSPTENGALLQ